ncbi:MAG: hypothetical protein EHM93_14730 [Bacteroidales bacterium]|nr:MAG: hypothetical protein EHM93_14730 [Bacteroidales bacterium]
MKQLITLTFFFASTICAYSQPTIGIYFTHHPYNSKGSAIESIEETYELQIKEVPPRPFKIKMLFDKNGNLLSEAKFNSLEAKQSETKCEYNQNQKLTKKTQRFFVNMIGWKVDETTIIYNDTTGYISEIRFIKNGTLEYISKVFCDKVGLPIEVRVLDNKGAFSMIERISYSPNANIIRVMLLKPSGQYSSLHLYPIDYTKPFQSGPIERQYYPSGEVMLESLDYQTKTDQGYFYEYQYDGQGNWIEKETYQVALGKNNKIKDKKLEHKIIRAIKYY